GNVDDERNALLLGDLRDGGALTGIESTDEKLRAIVDQFFRARARDLHVGLGVGVHDRQFRHADLLEDGGRELDAALAVLTDARLRAGARQQYADLQRGALRAQDGEWRRAGEQAGSGGGCCEAAAGQRETSGVRLTGHEILPRLHALFLLFSGATCNGRLVADARGATRESLCCRPRASGGPKPQASRLRGTAWPLGLRPGSF